MSYASTVSGLDALYPAQPRSVGAVRHAVTVVASHAGADDDALMRINLAVSEAVTNAVVHAYRDGRTPEDVHVVASCADGILDVSIRDTGVGMSPRPDSPGLGLGVGLMQHEAHHCSIRRHPAGGTSVALRFALRAGPLDGA